MSTLIKLYHRCSNYLLTFIQTQLAITIVSLPFLVAWGLGYSLMSFVGNLIFAPVLTLFLITSTILLFTELLGIPNAWIAYALNVITHCWQAVLSTAQSSWIVAGAKPPIIILILIPIVMFAALAHRRVNSTARRMGALSALLCTCFVIFWLQQQSNAQTIPTARFDEKLYVIKLAKSNELIVVDEGYFSRKKSADKSVEYELKPWITKRFGSVAINELRICKPSAGSFRAAAQLCATLKVKAVWLPFFKKSLSKYAWWAFFDLKRCMEERGTLFVRR